jgi:hypothetical protein
MGTSNITLETHLIGKSQYRILNTELAIHVLGQVYCPMSILEPKLGFSKKLPPSIFNHLCSSNYDDSYIA